MALGAEILVSLESPGLETFGEVLRKALCFLPQSSQGQSWFPIANAEQRLPLLPPLLLPRDQNLTLGQREEELMKVSPGAA